MKIKIIPFLIILLFALINPKPLQAEIVIQFFEKIKTTCPEIRPNFAKKMLVHFVLTDKNGEVLCSEKEDQMFKKLCPAGPDCKQASEIFLKTKRESSGNIIGR